MKIDLELTETDLLALWAYMAAEGPMQRMRRNSYLMGLYIGMFPLALMLVVLRSVPRTGYFVFGIAAALFAIAWTVFYFGVQWPATRRAFVQGANHLLGSHVFEMSDAEVGDAGPTGASSHKWRAVEAIRDAPDHVFIRVSGPMYYTLPKRAFADAGALERFLNRARDLRAKGAA